MTKNQIIISLVQQIRGPLLAAFLRAKLIHDLLDLHPLHFRVDGFPLKTNIGLDEALSCQPSLSFLPHGYKDKNVL